MGNAKAHSFIKSGQAVHPHVCGERVFLCPLIRSPAGSSPRVWGTPSCFSATSSAMRFIPTCVGNAVPILNVIILRTVHPHVCGERRAKRTRVASHVGSSPRVWGTRTLAADEKLPPRFIPTCVGNAAKSAATKTHGAVHPHVCGERIWRNAPARAICGSSPRVWGTLVITHIPASKARFIPTCVGNSTSTYNSLSSSTVHPHVCGELVC